MLYMESNIRPDISFSVHQCAQFKHNTNASHETIAKSMCRYLQSTKEKYMALNTSRRMVVHYYANEYFGGIWGHENPQYTIL